MKSVDKFWILECAIVQDEDYSYKYFYFDNAEDALEKANSICRIKSEWENANCPESIGLLCIPGDCLLTFLNEPDSYDWICMAHWFDIDTHHKLACV